MSLRFFLYNRKKHLKNIAVIHIAEAYFLSGGGLMTNSAVIGDITPEGIRWKCDQETE